MTTADTLILTVDGYRIVCDLVGERFEAIIDNNEFESEGFYSVGNKEVYKVTIDSGAYINGSPDHKILTNAGWKEISKLKVGNTLKLYENESDIITKIENIGCYYVYDCSIPSNMYVSEGGFYNHTHPLSSKK